jgi:hypothetical protein
MNNNEAQNLSGYLKLNNNSFKRVTIIPPITALNAPQNNDKTLIFTMDSWMGPLRFELDLSMPTTKTNNRVFIGNAFYPLKVHKQNKEELPNLTLVSRERFEKSKTILGGESTLWSEMVSKDNMDLHT